MMDDSGKRGNNVIVETDVDLGIVSSMKRTMSIDQRTEDEERSTELSADEDSRLRGTRDSGEDEEQGCRRP